MEPCVMPAHPSSDSDICNIPVSRKQQQQQQQQQQPHNHLQQQKQATNGTSNSQRRQQQLRRKRQQVKQPGLLAYVRNPTYQSALATCNSKLTARTTATTTDAARTKTAHRSHPYGPTVVFTRSFRTTEHWDSRVAVA